MLITHTELYAALSDYFREGCSVLATMCGRDRGSAYVMDSEGNEHFVIVRRASAGGLVVDPR